ncbi:MAG: HD domain-containing protein [Chloroflexota bacterium]
MYLQVVEGLKLSARPGAAPLLKQVSRFLAGEGIRSYLVGGFVRDALLGRETADIDIAVAADAPAVAARAAAALGGRYVLLDEANGVGRVVLPGTGQNDRWEIDFSRLRGDITRDLAQRDFTVDALAVDLEDLVHIPEEGELGLRASAIIDPLHGRDDLERRLIRAVSETAFTSDAARLLRAVRLAAELGFSIDSGTEWLIRQHCHLIAGVAGERVREELLRLLALPGAGQTLAYLDELGLLTAIFPELAPARGVAQPVVHFWDVFSHSIETVNTVEYLLRQSPWQYGAGWVLAEVPWSADLSRHFEREVSSGSTGQEMLKLAALLHDIAKPATKTVDPDGRARFTGHPAEGATMAAGIMERLRFSSREAKLVETLVKHHLRPGQMSNYGLPSPRAIYRYFRDTGEAGIDILFFSLADHLATRGPNLDPAGWREHAQLVAYVLQQHRQEKHLTIPPKIIDGHDLMAVFGLPPGPEIGRLLEAVHEAQAAGEVISREEALAYAGRLLSSPHNKRDS